MYQKIKAKFKANPTIFYACSIVASWAGVGSLMNFRTIALRYGAVPAIIWAVFNSLACITFGLFADRVPSIRRIMQSKVMFYFIGLLTLFQTWTQMSGIYEIFGDTPIGTKGGMIIVYVTCVAFLIMLLKDGMMDCHQRRQKLYQVEPHARPGRNAVCVLPGVLCWAERQAH